MTRPLRITYPGATYHAVSRGNARQTIFLDTTDRHSFLRILSSLSETHNWILHAYCLMGNHYHLLMETPEGNLSDGMRQLNSMYTQYFHRRHGTVGHVLQGRFKAHLIEQETYLLAVARYIVLNPVRAGLVKQPSQWRWSNYRATAGHQDQAEWLAVKPTLTLFHKRTDKARTAYREFVKAGIGKESPFAHVRNEGILGSEQFVALVGEQTEKARFVQEIPRRERLIDRPSLLNIFEGILDQEERNKAICFARNNCGYAMREIALHLRLHPSTISKVLHSRFKI